MSTELPPDANDAGTGPVLQLPARDSGAETLRNYRYQSAYGVILLIGAAIRKNDYISVWCEQEDDLLCQIEEKLFDSYQVKTQKPELGAWHLTDEAFVKAVKVFLRLDADFPNCIRHFNFVSNTDCLDTDDKKSTHLCPIRLAEASKKCSSHNDLLDANLIGLEALVEKTEGTKEALFAVVKKLRFAKSPDRDSFFAEIAQNHLREIEWCRLPQIKLETIVRSLIEMVDSASSLSSQDGSRHYAFIKGDGRMDPQLLAKRITVEGFILRSRELAGPTFRYLPSLTTSPLAQTNKDLRRFKLKLNRGDLDNYADSLRNQTLSAEAVFLDLATRGPEGQEQLTQLENVVKAECDAAHLRASQGVKPFGQKMLIDVQDRLRSLSENQPSKVARQPFEALMGMAGILTESCPVWWSEKFDLEEKP